MMSWLQDPETGLPKHRQEKLLQVFKCIDKVMQHLTSTKHTMPAQLHT